jgi:hypothetical protein
MQKTTTIKDDGGGLHHYPLGIIRLDFWFAADEDFELPAFNASAWRGAFGHALRRTACVTGQKTCTGCPLRESCVYAYLFETPPPAAAGRMRRYPSVPHPMVIRNTDPDRLRGNGLVPLEMLLFGEQAGNHLPFIIQALRRMGEQGLTRRRHRLRLQSVEQRYTDGSARRLWQVGATGMSVPEPERFTIPEAPGQPITLRFETPLRLMRQGRLIDAESLTPQDLLRSLTRRLSMLAYFHAGVDLVQPYRELHRQAATLAWLEPRFGKRCWTRWSSRQRQKIGLDGVVGEACLDLRAQTDLWPWLWLGQFVHAGKATVMGLGRYEIDDKLVNPAPVHVHE